MKMNRDFAKTMRIELIPEVSAEPVGGRQKRIVVASTEGQTRARKKIQTKSKTARMASPFQQLLQNVYDAGLITDLQGRILDMNDRALDFFGYPREDFLKASISDVISGADSSLIQTLLDNLENERYTLIQAYCTRLDGSYFPSEIATTKLMENSSNLCFFVRDITIRKQAEDMLMTEHNAIRNAGNGIAVVNLDGLLEYVNPAVVQMWGYPGKAFLDMPLHALMVDSEAVNQMLSETLEGDQSWTGEMQAKRENNEIFYIQISAACNRNRDGEVMGAVLSFVDTTETHRAEDAVRKAERHRVMLESLGAACHHLSQPATVLMGNIELLDQWEKMDSEQIQQIILSSMDAMHRLGAIIHRLNAVNEYRTTPYVKGENEEGSRILQI